MLTKLLIVPPLVYNDCYKAVLMAKRTINIKQMEERKQKLIQALKNERLRFAERGQNTTEHDIAIQFLLTGETSYNPDKWELLDAVINDFDTICSDYDC